MSEKPPGGVPLGPPTASETLSQATGVPFPTEPGKPNNVLQLEVVGTAVSLGSAGPTASMEDFVTSLRAIAPRDGTVLNLLALPKEMDTTLGPEPDQYKSSSTRSILNSGATYEDFLYIAPLDRYFCGRPATSKSHRLMIADDIPPELVLNQHKHAYLAHLQKDRNWSKPSMTGPLKSTQTEECRRRALRRWCEEMLRAKNLGHATKLVTDGLRREEQAAEKKAKAREERKQTLTQQLREKDRALDQAERDKERLRLDLARAELKAGNLFPKGPAPSTSTTAMETTQETDLVASGETSDPVADHQETVRLDCCGGATDSEPEETDPLSAAERARVNFILERKGLDQHPDNSVKPLLAEMLKRRPDLPVCMTCGEEWPFDQDGSDHQCEDVEVPNPEIPPAPGSFLDRQIKAAKAKRECSYALCRDPQGHCLKACPFLHQRCSVCRCRGHDDQEVIWNEQKVVACPKVPSQQDAMDTATRPTWQDLYHAFELSADQGFLTRYRSGHVACGFWPCWSMRDIHFVRALGHEHTRSVCAEDVVEIMTTLSNRLQTCPGFSDIPSFQALKECELSAITKEEVRNASLKPPRQEPRSKRAKRARDSSVPSTSGSDLTRTVQSRPSKPKSSRSAKPKLVQSSSGSSLNTGTRQKTPQSSSSTGSFAAVAAPPVTAPAPPAGLSSLGYYSALDWNTDVEASTSAGSTASAGAGKLPGPMQPGVDYTPHKLSAAYSHADYTAWNQACGPGTSQTAQVPASGPGPSRSGRGRRGGRGQSGHPRNPNHGRGGGNQTSGGNHSGGIQPGGANQGGGRGRGGPRGNRGGRGRGRGGASTPLPPNMAEVLAAATALVEATKKC